MTPPCVVFPASELQLHVQADLKGKKRKLQGGADVDLSKCALRMMTQWRCFVDDPSARDSPVGCWPVQRFFRQCQDNKGTFTVETTAWEDSNGTAKTDRYQGSRESPICQDRGKGGDGTQSTYHQWSRAWEEE